MSKRNAKSALSIDIDNKTIKGDGKSMFVYAINFISGVIGKEEFCESNQKIFNREKFINDDNLEYNCTLDDSGEFYIRTHSSTEGKKKILDNLSKVYDLDINVNIINFNELDNDDDVTSESQEEFDNSEINDGINKVCNATVEIKNYINDSNELCNKLKSTDVNYLRNYFHYKNSGVIIDIRKKIAKELLLFGSINSDKLDSIITLGREMNPQPLKVVSIYNII